MHKPYENAAGEKKAEPKRKDRVYSDRIEEQ